MPRWYIEAHKGESWRDLSREFGEAIRNAAGLGDFGWHEGSALSVGSRTFYCFDFPDHHGEKIALFEAWAKTTGRAYGYAKEGRVYFPDDPSLVAVLPTEPSIPAPSWLR